MYFSTLETDLSNLMQCWNLCILNSDSDHFQKVVQIHLYKCFLSLIDFFFFSLGLPLQHMEVLRLGVELELQLLAYTADSPSNVRSKPHLPPMLQFVATLDP